MQIKETSQQFNCCCRLGYTIRMILFRCERQRVRQIRAVTTIDWKLSIFFIPAPNIAFTLCFLQMLTTSITITQLIGLCHVSIFLTTAERKYGRQIVERSVIMEQGEILPCFQVDSVGRKPCTNPWVICTFFCSVHLLKLSWW